MSEEVGRPQAGWYPDPEGGFGERYWDGSVWTDGRRPNQPNESSSPWRTFSAVWLGLLAAAAFYFNQEEFGAGARVFIFEVLGSFLFFALVFWVPLWLLYRYQQRRRRSQRKRSP